MKVSAIVSSSGRHVWLNNTIMFCSSGRQELVEALQKDEKLSKNKRAMEGLEDMKLLLRYCELMGVLDKVCFKNVVIFALI